MKIKKFISALVASAMLIAAVSVSTNAEPDTRYSSARYMEYLDRGLIAMESGGGIYLTWRLLGTEEYNTTFDVYRGEEKIASAISDSTDYFDADGDKNSQYKVVPSGETPDSAEKTVSAFSSGRNYLEFPVAPIEDYSYNGVDYEYKIHDASVGDVDGDGEYEIIVKREANHQHAGAAGHNHMYIEAYKLNGTILWRIDMGQNMRAMTEFVFLVYDFNNDGAAEIACKTAPGSKDAAGKYVTAASTVPKIKNADNSANYYNEYEYLLEGPEYFTLFDGRNGQALDTIEYPLLRGTDANNTMNNIWGDNYGHRCEKCMGVVSYFDGVNPGITLWRGIYPGKSGFGAGRTAAANISVNSNTNRMSVGERFDTWSGGNGYKSGYEKYIGQGNHSIACGDVDNDGKDEVMSGGLCLDHDLTPLWCTYRGHGDAHHLANYDPRNDALEYFTVQEEGGTTIANDFGETIKLKYGMTLINALTGKEILHNDNTKDTGRGMMANTGQGGYYQITAADLGTYTAKEDGTYEKAEEWSGMNFRIFWDDDLYDELFDSVSAGSLDFRPAITDFNRSTGKYERTIISDDVVTINHTKSAPLLQADIFGDWREELVFKTLDDMAIRIYTTDIPTDNKLYTLMHDSLYRQGVALQNQYYNQPPHISYYICEDDDPLYNKAYDKRSVKPNIQTVRYSGQAPSVTAVPVEPGVKTRNESYIIDEDGDYYNEINKKLSSEDGWIITTVGADRQSLLATTNDTEYLAATEKKKHFKGYRGKFLLFSANGADSVFKKTSENAVPGTGKLEFAFSIPGTFSDNGVFPYGNAPTTIYVGDGTDSALEFTITPNISKSYVESAVLSINGTNICSYSSMSEAQYWTKAECALDNVNKKAYISVTKSDGKIYTAEVNYLNSRCVDINTFGVNASGYYGTVALDEIRLYSTDSLEKPLSSATDSYRNISFTKYHPNKKHFYDLDLGNISSGTITKKVLESETKADTSKYNVGNFRTGTLKTAALPELDGWGYVHAAYDNTSGRQTAAGVNAENNSVILYGTSNVGGSAVSFIPKNIEGITMPTTGTLTYRFKAVVSKAGGSAAGTVTYGFTSSANGSSITNVNSVNISNSSDNDYVKEVNMVMTYDLDTKEYSIEMDGTVAASGTAPNITGIFMQSSNRSYTNGAIQDLVLEASADIPAPTPTPTVKEHFYDLDLRNISSGMITKKLPTNGDANKAPDYNVGNFRLGTAITDAVPELDGWGYIHVSFSDLSSNSDGRQTSSSVDADTNSVILNGTSNVGGSVVSFIPKNIEGITMPTAGILKYKFKAIVSGNVAGKDATYGFTSASDGSSVANAGSVVIKTSGDSNGHKNEADIVMTYDLDTKKFSINVDGSDKVSGTSSNITGIFMQSSKGAWTNSTITDLVLDVITPTPAPTTMPTATPTVTPTASPTASPTAATTTTPTATPMDKPTETPTTAPTATPTATPTKIPETVPDIVIDYANEMLTSFDGGNYIINSAAVTPADGKLPVADYIGKTISIVKKASGSDHSDSAVQSLTIPARPASPGGFETTNTRETENTGTISGITAAMEYKKEEDADWTDGTGKTVSGLGRGTYLIRIKAASGTFSSEVTRVTITKDGIYSITYHTDGGEIENIEQYEIYTEGRGMKLPIPIKTGYTFGGWYDNEDLTGVSVTDILSTDNINKEFWATWTKNAEYINALGDFANKLTIEKITGDNGAISLKIISKDGYTLPELKLYSAVYNSDNSMKSVSVLLFAADNDGNIIIPLSEPQPANNETYKLMLWDNSQTPVINTISNIKNN